MTMARSFTICFMLFALSSAAQTKYGNLIGDFESGSSHQISGSVYAVDETTLFIKAFTFDGNSTCAVFYVGTSSLPNSGGDVIPVGNGRSDILRLYQSEDVMISLAAGKITDYVWFSIWCQESQESFAHVVIPENFLTPKPMSLGELGFSRRVHNVHADNVIILNSKQIKFVDLDYDGGGPEAFFWTGDGSPDRGDSKVPHPADRPNQILPRFSGATLTITLPEGLTVSDVDFIGLWCILARQNFGHVQITELDIANIPPVIELAITPLPSTTPILKTTLMLPTISQVSQKTRLPQTTSLPSTTPLLPTSCEVLLPNRFHIAWTVDQDNNKITLEFRGILSLNEYLAFGISGSKSKTTMVGSDVSVVWFDSSDSEPRAEDYHLNAYSQCLPIEGIGACPDQLQNGENNVVLLHGSQRNGLSVIRIERPLQSSDPLDLDIITTGDVFVSWGIGFINPTGHVAKHDTRVTGDVVVNFGGSSSICPVLKEMAVVDPTPWVIEPLRPKCGETLTAVIGPSGGQQGYQGIADQVGWGFAWYINGLLIPEIYVERGCNYTFLINGGDDAIMTGTYHPFYITNDKDGGFLQKTSDEKTNETIYSPAVEGPLCEYQTMINPDDFNNFDDYQKTLSLNCFNESGQGVMTWQVATDTPDLVYYQCYQHRFFGWKIRVSGSSTLARPVASTLIGVSLALLFFKSSL